MFDRYVFNASPAPYATAVLLVDHGLEERTSYSDAFAKRGYTVVRWKDDLSFRIAWEDVLRAGKTRLAVIAKPGEYIPYDLLQFLQRYDVSLNRLFPLLDADVLGGTDGLDLDFLAVAYEKSALGKLGTAETRRFLHDCIHDSNVAQSVYQDLCQRLGDQATAAKSWSDWVKLAELKARADEIGAEYGLDESTNTLVDGRFQDFMLSGYSKLTQALSDSSPVILSSVMDYIHDRSERFAIIVMDGMSEFDWRGIARSFKGITYDQGGAFAMVPTVTSISRQCLLSGKKPVQLVSPWSQSKEKSEFYACVRGWGAHDEQIFYGRGYGVDMDRCVDYAAIVINDVDDMVHGQKQGRRGMLNDMRLLGDEGRLAGLVLRLTKMGYDVYITADHGNTPCIGMGHLTKTGVETQTKGKRMVVFKDFAEAEGVREKYGLIEFPKTYLDKGYTYYLCRPGESFDDPGARVMSHGGISIDEVIVPFITVEAEG